MLSKQKVKLVNALQVKKYRKIHQSFLVQGRKSVLELFHSSYEVIEIFASSEFIELYKSEINSGVIIHECDEVELKKISAFNSNNSVVAIAKIPQFTFKEISQEGISLVLDQINDPGNLGTIIRLADWYDVKNIYCSIDCADFFNPKVIASTMGSFSRVKVFYIDLQEELGKCKLPIWAADLEGETVHEYSFSENGVLLMGSESHGVNPELMKLVTNRITIPRYGKAESLNVAMATGIILDNIKR